MLIGGLIGALFGGLYFLVLHYRGAQWLDSLQLPSLNHSPSPTNPHTYQSAQHHQASPAHPNTPTPANHQDSDVASVSSAASTSSKCAWIYNDYGPGANRLRGGSVAENALGFMRRSHSENDINGANARQRLPRQPSVAMSSAPSMALSSAGRET